jgi:hypothetical protein
LIKSPIARSTEIFLDIPRCLTNGYIESAIKSANEPYQLVATTKPRFHVVHNITVNKVDEEGSKIWSRVLKIVLVDKDNAPLHQGALQLTLKGGTVTGATFYDLVMNQKKPDSWYMQVCSSLKAQGFKGNPSPKLLSLFAIHMSLIQGIYTGKGYNTAAAKFDRVKKITDDESVFIESMFVGNDSTKKSHLISLVESFEASTERSSQDFDDGDDRTASKFPAAPTVSSPQTKTQNRPVAAAQKPAVPQVNYADIAF